MATADFSVAPSPALVGSPSVGQPPVDPNTQGFNPFRVATLEKVEVIGQTGPQAITTAEQIVEVPIVGSGLIYGFDLFVQNVTAANAAVVAYHEDAPFSALSQITLRDVNGPVIDASGFHLKWIGRYGGWEPAPWPDQVVPGGTALISADANLFLKTAGAVGAGGSFTFHEKLPIAYNRRTLLPLLGNQDRSQQYTLRHNIASGAAAATGPIYTTAPTTQGNITIVRNYENYAVPNATNDNGVQNQVLPGHYGIVPFVTQTVNDALPTGGSQVNHYVRRVGNVIRGMMLVFRQAGSRANAEAAMPTNIQLKVGNEVIFNESTAYRRQAMWDRYGADAPSGVLMYDFIHDFWRRAGDELGNDWLWTQNLNQFQFVVTYPTGFTANAANSLTIVTSDMIVPEGINPYAF